MAARKKKVVEVVEEVVEAVTKPFKIDQDKGTKFRYEFKSWADYSKYKGEKS